MRELGQEWTVWKSAIRFKELSAAPNDASTMPANTVSLYAKDNGSGVSSLCYQLDNGTEICMPTSGSLVTGTGVSGRIAFWNGTTTLTSDSDLTFSVDTLTATKIIAPTSVTISTLTLGSILFAGTAGIISQDNANFFWDSTNHRLGIGTAAPGFQIHAIAPDAASFNCTIEAYGTGVSANYRGRVARGTAASPSQLTTDDNCTLISALPYNNSPGFASTARAQIQMNAAEAQTSTNQGMYINFKTTPTGSTTIAERFRIGPAGQWGIGGATYGSSGAYFRSGGASAAPVWSTLILPNAATANDIVYATSSNTWGESANLQFDGTDFILGSGIRARMSGQNRFRYLNSMVRATRSAALSLSDNTWTLVDWDTEDFDTDSLHSTSSNKGRLTCALTGKYLIVLNAGWAAAAGGVRFMSIEKNAAGTEGGGTRLYAAVFPADPIGSNGTYGTMSVIANLTATDYVEAFMYQNSGGTINADIASGGTWPGSFSMFYIGE